jgi:hypothetical protein
MLMEREGWIGVTFSVSVSEICGKRMLRLPQTSTRAVVRMRSPWARCVRSSLRLEWYSPDLTCRLGLLPVAPRARGITLRSLFRGHPPSHRSGIRFLAVADGAELGHQHRASTELAHHRLELALHGRELRRRSPEQLLALRGLCLLLLPRPALREPGSAIADF